MIFLGQLEQFYESDGLENLRLSENGDQYIEFLTATKYLDMHLPKNARILDNCAGTGVYSFYLASKGHSVFAGDIVEYNVDLIKQKQIETPILEQIYQGDAMNLPQFEDSSFDAVLCMGALYHLHSDEERIAVVKESIRLLKPNGLFVCSYMNRYAVIMNNSLHISQRDRKSVV